MKYASLLILCILFSGCFLSKAQVGVPIAVLLPEDRVFTLTQGTKIPLMLDNKPVELSFPADMFVVSKSYLVRQEQTLNNTALDKVGAEKKSSTLMAILASLSALLATGLGAFLKLKLDSASKK